MNQESVSGTGLWAIVLAGGEGTRLRPLIRQLCGDERPKQYAPLLGSRSLLRATLDRVRRAIPRQRTVVVVSRWHVPYIASAFSDFPELHLLAQPRDRGTAAGLLLAVHWIRARDPQAIVAVFPSDHFFADEPGFISHVSSLAPFALRYPDRIVLVGAKPSGPETEFGWIEPSDPLDGARDGGVRSVRRFWEKPASDVAEACFRAGCLWNTFVMVGNVGAFVEAGRRFMPHLHERFLRFRSSTSTQEQAELMNEAYAPVFKVDFSRAVLEARPEFLAVSELPDVGWSDWGTPERVFVSLKAAGLAPAWLGRPRPAPTKSSVRETFARPPIGETMATLSDAVNSAVGGHHV
jgi:mannose-1-phosphate guanylyltransferase